MQETQKRVVDVVQQPDTNDVATEVRSRNRKERGRKEETIVKHWKPVHLPSAQEDQQLVGLRLNCVLLLGINFARRGR